VLLAVILTNRPRGRIGLSMLVPQEIFGAIEIVMRTFVVEVLCIISTLLRYFSLPLSKVLCMPLTLVKYTTPSVCSLLVPHRNSLGSGKPLIETSRCGNFRGQSRDTILKVRSPEGQWLWRSGRTSPGTGRPVMRCFD
jgi:hypothetical protein